MNKSINTSSTSDSFSLEKTIKLMKEIDRKKFDFLLGLPVQLDRTGMFVGDNEYIVLCGKKVWESLQELTQKREGEK